MQITHRHPNIDHYTNSLSWLLERINISFFSLHQYRPTALPNSPPSSIQVHHPATTIFITENQRTTQATTPYPNPGNTANQLTQSAQPRKDTIQSPTAGITSTSTQI
jgi:hypothetical protein